MALKVLGWFGYKVTMPFLNMAEKAEQQHMVEVLQRLYGNLQESKVYDVLSAYKVDYSFPSPVPEMASTVQTHSMLPRSMK